ncbi:hypothetical protein ACFLXD_05405 [Chloroflexota bacterium]
MGFLSGRQSPNMPPLVELPKGGDPIVFDDDEQRVTDREIKYQHETFYKDKIFPEDVT